MKIPTSWFIIAEVVTLITIQLIFVRVYPDPELMAYAFSYTQNRHKHSYGNLFVSFMLVGESH